VRQAGTQAAAGEPVEAGAIGGADAVGEPGATGRADAVGEPGAEIGAGAVGEPGATGRADATGWNGATGRAGAVDGAHAPGWFGAVDGAGAAGWTDAAGGTATRAPTRWARAAVAVNIMAEAATAENTVRHRFEGKRIICLLPKGSSSNAPLRAFAETGVRRAPVSHDAPDPSSDRNRISAPVARYSGRPGRSPRTVSTQMPTPRHLSVRASARANRIRLAATLSPNTLDDQGGALSCEAHSCDHRSAPLTRLHGANDPFSAHKMAMSSISPVSPALGRTLLAIPLFLASTALACGSDDTGVTAAQGGSGGTTAQGGSGGATAQGGSGGATAQGGSGGGTAQGGSGGATAQGGSGGTTAQGGSGGAAGQGGSTADAGGTVAAGVRWIGRVDTSNTAAPKFAWTGTGLVATVSGSDISVKLRTENGSSSIFFQPVIDGTVGQRFSIASGADRTVSLGTALTNADHIVELYRETEGMYGQSVFLGFATGTLKAPPAWGGRLIEVIGDSISAGYGTLGTEPHPNWTTPTPCHYTTDTQSAYQTYGAKTARALNADASILALSGWGMYRSRTATDFTNVLPKAYANTLGTSATPAWNFQPKPQAVVINLGTNDYAVGDPGQPYVTAYLDFVATIRKNYPDAWIFCAVGSMLGQTEHDKIAGYLNTVITTRAGQGDTKMAFVDLGIQDALVGTGCDWHPNVADHQRMADTLAPAIKAKLGW
jgi:hypothetical protein